MKFVVYQLNTRSKLVCANPFNLTVSSSTKSERLVYLHLKQQVQFFQVCFSKTSAETSFKELPMTISVPVVLGAYSCGCRHTGYIKVIMQGKCGRNTETTFDIK